MTVLQQVYYLEILILPHSNFLHKMIDFSDHEQVVFSSLKMNYTLLALQINSLIHTITLHLPGVWFLFSIPHTCCSTRSSKDVLRRIAKNDSSSLHCWIHVSNDHYGVTADITAEWMAAGYCID